MTVTVTIKFPVADIPKAIEGLDENAAVLAASTDETKSAGILHHRFVAGDGELMVIDEWESAEQFQAFFESNTKIPEIMTAIGMSGPPEINVYQAIDDPASF